MPKKIIQRFLPSHDHVRKNKYLQFMGDVLHDPNLFHLNRRSAAGAFAVGLFCAFMPIPFQMVLAAVLAAFVRVNMPLSIMIVWVTNPITMPPIFFTAYKVGSWVLAEPVKEFSFELSWEWLAHAIEYLGPPFFLGCLICGAVAGFIGYMVIRILWRRMVIRSWKKRQSERGYPPFKE